MATTTQQINEIKSDLSDAYTALGSKGATLPAANARGSANLASTVGSISMPTYPCTLWNVGGTGTVTVSTGTFAHAFDNWVTANGAPKRQWAGKQVIDADIEFPNLTTIGANGMQEFMYNVDVQTGSSGNKIKFTSLTSIGRAGLYNAFYNAKGFSEVSFDNLTDISALDSFSSAFERSKITKASFPKLTSFGNSGVDNSFKDCTLLTSVEMPELVYFNGGQSTFSGCTSLTSMNFPKVKRVGNAVDMFQFTYMFSGCTSLASVNFPVLEEIKGKLGNMFYNCTALTTISFPSLTTIYPSEPLLNNMFNGCTNLTAIHFPSAIQSAVESTQGYSSKFGASNATIYFDL